MHDCAIAQDHQNQRPLPQRRCRDQADLVGAAQHHSRLGPSGPEFLGVAGVFDNWVDACPLSYTSGNASDKRDALGTILLGILAGNKRYAHLSSIRGDAVAAKALGMSKRVSPDAVRRALMCIEQPDRMRPALMSSVLLALDKPWILDIDTTPRASQFAIAGQFIHAHVCPIPCPVC
jgi:hypothetical protein